MSGLNDLSNGVKIFIAAVSGYIVLLFPAAMIFLSEWAFTVYLIFIGVFIIGVLPASLIIYKIYWDGQKFLSAQVARQPFNSFKETIDKLKEYTRDENEVRRFPALKGKIFDIFFSAKNILTTSTIIGIILIAVPLIWAEYLWAIAYIGFFLPFKAYRGIFHDWNNIEQSRNQQVSRIYDILKPIMKFELPPQYCIMVAAWEDKVVPKQINIIYPSTFRGDSQQAKDSFESAFSATVSDDNAWIYTWYPTKSAVVCRPVEDIPKYVEYKGSSMFEWHTFPIGVGLGDKGQEIISYSVTKNKSGVYHPHVLIAGTTGSGKSVIQRNILFHCIQHNDMWKFLGIDLKQVELGRYEKYSQTVMGVATNLEDGVKFLRYAQEVMLKRYARMKEAGVSFFLDLVNEETGKPDPALLVMIDEAYEFLAPSGIKTAQGKMEDELHQEASFLLSSIARLGRAAGIHLVLATQRPDATVIKGEMKNNLDVRIAAGRLDNTPSLMVLDSAAATTLPDIKGRGVVRFANKTRQFQGFYANEDWIDKWLSKPQNRWREPELTSTMFPAANPDEQPVRVANKKPLEEPKGNNLDNLIEEISQTEVKVDNGPAIEKPEDLEEFGFEDEEMPSITDEELDREAYFDDELGLNDEDDISDEEIEQLLNELAMLDDEDDTEEGEDSLDIILIDDEEEEIASDAFEKIISSSSNFEQDFENIFNTDYSEIKTQSKYVPVVETVSAVASTTNHATHTPLQLPPKPQQYVETETPPSTNIAEKIKKMPKPPSLSDLEKQDVPPTPIVQTKTDTPSKPKFPTPKLGNN